MRHNALMLKDFAKGTEKRSKLPDAKLETTYCCGIKDLHNIHSYGDAKECVTHALAWALDPFSENEKTRLLAHFRKVGNDERLAHARTNAAIKVTIAKPAHFVFSETQQYSIGTLMMAFILEHKLGGCVCTTRGYNVNSGNQVKVFVWTPDWEACGAFFKETGYRRPTTRSMDDFGVVLDFPEPVPEITVAVVTPVREPLPKASRFTDIRKRAV